MYDAITASHYSAYRPPFHAIILERALSKNKKRKIGLDIGCGTGRSAYELADFCDHVVGLDSNKSMLSKTKNHKKVNFINSPGEQIPIAAKSVDVVTLAGSLNYINRTSLINELLRICQADSEIIVYDFEIDLARYEEFLGIFLISSSPEYDHSANLSEHTSFDEVTVVEDEYSVNASPTDIAHLLLSNRIHYKALCEKYKASDPLTMVEGEIGSMLKIPPIKAAVFYSVYSLSHN